LWSDGLEPKVLVYEGMPVDRTANDSDDTVTDVTRHKKEDLVFFYHISPTKVVLQLKLDSSFFHVEFLLYLT